MILEKDDKNMYCYQLTKAVTQIVFLEYALKSFRSCVEAHCVVRVSVTEDRFAVFTAGKTVFLETPNVWRNHQRAIRIAKTFPKVVSA